MLKVCMEFCRCPWSVEFVVGNILEISRALPLTRRACLGKKNVRFRETGPHGSQALLPRDVIGHGIVDFAAEESDCDVQSILRSGDLLCAMVRQHDKGAQLVSRANVQSRELISVRHETVGCCVDLSRLFGPFKGIVHKSACDADTKRKPCGGERCIQCRVASLLAAVLRCNVQRNDYCATRSDCRRYVPEVLRGTGHPRDDHPHLGESEEGDTDEQPNGCQVCEFPRAFHDFPVFDFRAIVARPTEGS